MKIGKSNLRIRSALLVMSFSLLLPSFAQAATQNSVLGFNSFSMEISKAVTPDPNFAGVSTLMFDDPQMPTDNMVVSFTMTPSTTTGWQAGLSFRYTTPNDTSPPASATTSYNLNISPSNVALLSSINGVSTLIKGASAPLATSPASPAHLQLTESGSTFTLVNLTTGQQLFSVSDSTVPYGYSYFLSSPPGSPACTWTNFYVQANGASLPSNPNAAAVIQDFDEDDTATTFLMGNHFAVDNANCSLFVGLAPMVQPPNDTTPVAFVNARASGTSGEGTSYLLMFYSDHIAICKSINGVVQSPSLAKSAPGSIALVTNGPHVNFVWTLQGSTLTVKNASTGQQVLTCTDPTNPIASGYRFAPYTEPGFHTCWSSFVLQTLP